VIGIVRMRSLVAANTAFASFLRLAPYLKRLIIMHIPAAGGQWGCAKIFAEVFEIMLQTVEGIIDVDGQIRWLEPLRVAKPSRVLVTLLPDTNGSRVEPESNLAALQAFLQSPDFVNRPTGSAEEIEAQIQEMRTSWD
jgi:hypothetical protein